MFGERIPLRYSPPEEHHGCKCFGRMVLHSTPWCSSLALGLIWRCHIGYWGWGSSRRQKHWAKGPHAEEKALSSSTVGLGVGPRNYQVVGKHPFLCQRCVISLREIVPSEKKAMTTRYSTLAWNNPRTERLGRLQSMGSLRVKHHWVTSLSLFTFLNWSGNGNPLKCSCLENSRDGEAWWVAGYGVAQNQIRLKQLSSSSSSSFWTKGVN